METIRLDEINRQITERELYDCFNVYFSKKLKCKKHNELIDCLDYMDIKELPLDIIGSLVSEVIKGTNE